MGWIIITHAILGAMLQLTVIIPTLYRNRFVLQILSALHAQKKYIAEILVIDGSPERTARKLVDLENHNHSTRIRYFHNKQGDSVSARNIGLEKSTSNYIAFLDDDCIPEKNWAQRYVHFFANQKNNKKCIVMGSSRNGYPRSVIASVEHYRTEKFFKNNIYKVQNTYYSYCLDTKNWAAYLPEVKKYSLKFDYRYSPYNIYEDIDFGLSARNKGFKIRLVPQARVVHYGRQNILSYFKRERDKMYGYEILNRKWHIATIEERISNLLSRRPTKSNSLSRTTLTYSYTSEQSFRFKTFFYSINWITDIIDLLISIWLQTTKLLSAKA